MRQIFFNKLNLICGLLILICINAFAQSPSIEGVRPMTPNIAALFKLTDRPVGSFTGTAPVSFPLMTVTSGPLSVNLSLDYSTSGIKVEEVASSIGLGFSFNDGGGRIVQRVNGLPDDKSGGLLDPMESVKPSNFNSSNSEHLWKAYIGLDLEPDIFMYSFAGKSGNFSFQENGDIININENGLKIERISNGFKITDGEGIQYYFTTVSQNSYGYGNGTVYSPGPIKSSNWYLTEISDINNENQIKFTYVSSGGSFYGFSSGYKLIGTTLCPDLPSPYSESYVGTTSAEMILAKVEGCSGYVICNSSNDRLDMTSARKINSLEAYDTNGNLKKKYKFNYSYTSGAGSNNRLKLNNFSEFGANTVDSLVYKFDYESGELPAYNSKAVDFWGYYNGQSNNSSHFSDLVYRNGSFIVRQDLWNEVDRTPNPFYAKAQSLSKITYPSGGYRQFVYEGNSISQSVNFSEFVPDPDVANVQTFSITSFSGVGIPGTYAQKFFTVNSTYGGAYFKAIISSSSPTNNIRIYRANPGSTSGGIEVFGQPQMNVYKWDLPNGNYRLDVNSSSVTSLNAIWKECTAVEGSYYNRKVGGIRIKEIRDYDPVSNKTNTTRYLYKKYSSDSTISSGELIVQLRLTGYEYSRPQCGYDRLNANGIYQLTADGGSYAVYPEVRTIEDGNGWNDRIYKYIRDSYGNGRPQAPNISYSALRGQLESEKIYNQNGTLLKRTVVGYQGMGTASQLGIRVRAIFGVDNPAGNQKATFSPQPGYSIPTTGWVTTWFTTNNKLAIKYSIDSVFNANGIITMRTDYTYENNGKYFLPRQVKTTNSNGTTREVNYRYASTPNTEFALGLTADEQAMKTTLFSKNYLQPLEITNTITTSGGTADLVNGKKMIFNNFNGTKSRLSSVKEYSSLLDFRETFLSSYDDKGNLMEKYINPSLREVYLWGYNTQYPVAKIVSSDYTTVRSIIPQSQIDDITSIPDNEQALRSLLNNLRSNLPNSQIWTYTYKPLVGMTSQTDAKGQTTYYEYDNFQRLKNVKDQNGNIINNTTYHYKP